MKIFTKKANELLTNWKNAGKGRTFKGVETDDVGYLLTLSQSDSNGFRSTTMVTEKGMLDIGLLDKSLGGDVKLLMMVDHALSGFEKNIPASEALSKLKNSEYLEKTTSTCTSAGQSLHTKLNSYVAGGNITKKEFLLYPYCDWLFLTVYCGVMVPISILFIIPLVMWRMVKYLFRLITRRTKNGRL